MDCSRCWPSTNLWSKNCNNTIRWIVPSVRRFLASIMADEVARDNRPIKPNKDVVWLEWSSKSCLIWSKSKWCFCLLALMQLYALLEILTVFYVVGFYDIRWFFMTLEILPVRCRNFSDLLYKWYLFFLLPIFSLFVFLDRTSVTSTSRIPLFLSIFSGRLDLRSAFFFSSVVKILGFLCSDFI